MPAILTGGLGFSWTLVDTGETLTTAQSISKQADTAGRDFKLASDDGDLQIGMGFSLVTGVDAIIQSLRLRLNFVQGEWFADRLAGIPYMTDILGVKNPNLSAIRGYFVETIEQTVGVKELLQLTMDFATANRTLTLVGRVSTDTNEIIDFRSAGAPDQ